LKKGYLNKKEELKQAQGGKSAADLFVAARDAELVFGIGFNDSKISQTDELQRVALN
jgi:hypothetical protein